MAIAMYHEADATAEQYDEALRRLEEAGAGAPDGRMHHFAFELGTGKLAVFDIWESEEQLGAFAETLVPILEEVTGAPPPPPRTGLLHNSISA